MKTIENYVNKIKNVLNVDSISLPDFKNKSGLRVHKNQHSITVIHHENEIEEHKYDDTPLLGIFRIDLLEEESWLFVDAIKTISKNYSKEKSRLETMGQAITAKPTGLLENDAFNYIEILCKIDLTLLSMIYTKYGKWISDFYSTDNIDFIDILVCQLTKEVIKDDTELIECFEWLKINNVETKKFFFKEPISLIKNFPNTGTVEFELLDRLDIFINYFPIENKNLIEPWNAFFSRVEGQIQDTLINAVKEYGSGWEIIEDYLTEENKVRWRNKITSVRYGLAESYKRKWWKIW
jgi:hypothetical protein